MKKRLQSVPFSKSCTQKQFYTYWFVISTIHVAFLQLCTPRPSSAWHLGTKWQVSTWQKTLTELLSFRIVTWITVDIYAVTVQQNIAVHPASHHFSLHNPICNCSNCTFLTSTTFKSPTQTSSWCTQQCIMLPCFLYCCIPLLPLVNWSA